MHKWQFFKSARCVQAKVETGDDLLALKELDKKLWTVLAAPTTGVRFDEATLKLLDADGDGRVRVPEVLAAVDWMAARFKKLDFLFAGNAEIPLDELRDNTPEGQALLKSFKNLLARAGKSDATTLALADVTGMTDVFNAQPFNGDGVVTAKSTADAATLSLPMSPPVSRGRRLRPTPQCLATRPPTPMPRSRLSRRRSTSSSRRQRICRSLRTPQIPCCL